MGTIADKNHKMPIFEKRFRQLREKYELSQDAFAKFIGLSRPTIGFYENGDRIPDALTLKKIAVACKVPCDWLIGISDNEYYENIAIGADLGLTDDAIDTLQFNCRWDHPQGKRKMNAINRLLDTNEGYDFLYALSAFLDSNAQYHGSIDIVSNGEIIDDYTASEVDRLTTDDARCTHITYSDNMVLYTFENSYAKQELLLQAMCARLRELRNKILSHEQSPENVSRKTIADLTESLINNTSEINNNEGVE